MVHRPPNNTPACNEFSVSAGKSAYTKIISYFLGAWTVWTPCSTECSTQRNRVCTKAGYKIDISMLYSDQLSSIIILKPFQDQVRNKQNDCTKAGPEIQIKECKNDRKTCWKDRTDLMPKKLQACPLRQSDRKRRSGMHTLQSRIISGLGAFSN